MLPTEVLGKSALEQARLLRTGEVSCLELVETYLDRIERLDPKLCSFVSVFGRSARLDARARDRRLRAARRGSDPLPRLFGVPTGVKDLNLVRASFTRLGSAAIPPIWSPIDDRTARALRRAGLVFLGKLAASEAGAMPVTEPEIHGPTRNPWNLTRSSGGSSGGSGAALAAELIPIAQGSDGAGSIRIPSALCHLYGLKPSRGRVANAYGLPDRRILYTCGPMARTVADAAAMLDVLAGTDGGALPHWAPAPGRPFAEECLLPPRRLRVRVCTASLLGPTDPEIAAAVERAARTVAALGHDVEEFRLPEIGLEEFLPIWQAQIAQLPFSTWRRAQPITRWLAAAGRGIRAEEIRALHLRLEEQLLRAFGEADLWLTPAVATTAPRVGAYRDLPPAEGFAQAARLGAFTAPFNVTGQPAASLPLGLSAEGLPFGLQIAGRLYAEVDVLQLSRQLEEALPWRGRRSPIALQP
jgi:amidase